MTAVWLYAWTDDVRVICVSVHWSPTNCDRDEIVGHHFWPFNAILTDVYCMKLVTLSGCRATQTPSQVRLYKISATNGSIHHAVYTCVRPEDSRRLRSHKTTLEFLFMRSGQPAAVDHTIISVVCFI